MKPEMEGREAGWLYKLDDRVKYGGQVWRVGAFGYTGGEAYYWLCRRREVAMLTRATVEQNSELIPGKAVPRG